MSTLAVALLIAVQVLAAVALTPLLVGVMRQTRARMEGRAGAGVGQPWRDVRKLLAKEPLRAAGTGPLMAAAPLVLMVSSLMVCALVPLVGTPTLPLVPDDLFVVVSLLLLGTAALALLGLESGTAFGGMGSSRHMTIAALVEPTVLVAVYALSIPVGTSALSAIVAARAFDPAIVVSPVSLLAVVALALAVLAETGRLPVDNPSTHLELTMVHEAMVLESSGRDLAWLELGSLAAADRPARPGGQPGRPVGRCDHGDGARGARRTGRDRGQAAAGRCAGRRGRGVHGQGPAVPRARSCWPDRSSWRSWP